MGLNLLRPMIYMLRFERKKTVTPKEGEEDRRRGLISTLEEENAKGRTDSFSRPIRNQFQVTADTPWELDDFLQLLDDDQQEALSDFLEVDRKVINRQQRIILVAEAYDYALLIGAEWLSEHYGVDIICCRIALAKDSLTETEYLVCSNVYPAPELAKEALSRGRDRTGTSKVKWTDWETALSGITNNSLVSYFKQELAASRESYLPQRALRYRIAGKRRWSVEARNKNAYVWQTGRFEGDVEFWQHGLSKPDDVKPVGNEECVRLFLNIADDFQFFHDAVTEKLQSSEWLGGALEEEKEETEEL